MRLRDIEPYINLKYDRNTFDCADLTLLIQRELFHRDVTLPGRRLRGAAGLRVIGSLSQEHGERTETPVDGDLVAIRDFGQTRAGHVGVYFFLAHEGWVLHSTDKIGYSICHRVRDLPDFGLQVEGFYRWK